MGVKLGSPEHFTDETRAKGRAARSAAARLCANGALTHAVAYRAARWSPTKILELNQAGARPRRRKLSPTTVLRLPR